jgi:hypothetical protein
MTYSLKQTRCLVRISGEFIAIFDDLPSPKVLGKALVKLLQQDELGSFAKTYFQDIVKADWVWSTDTDLIEAEGLLHKGAKVALTAEHVPFFLSGNPVYQ